MESIINQNAGLIDDGNLHKEMVELKTHIIIIRSAFERKFNSGEEIIQLLQDHTFPKKMYPSYQPRLLSLSFGS